MARRPRAEGTTVQATDSSLVRSESHREQLCRQTVRHGRTKKRERSGTWRDGPQSARWSLTLSKSSRNLSDSALSYAQKRKMHLTLESLGPHCRLSASEVCTLDCALYRIRAARILVKGIRTHKVRGSTVRMRLATVVCALWRRTTTNLSSPR